MTDEHRDDAVLFVLGQLGEPETRALVEEAARDPELAALITDYRATLAVVALSPEQIEPPARLRQTILALASKPDEPAEPIPLPSPPRVTRLRRALVLPWALAACLAIACVVLAFRLSVLHRENATLLADRDDWSNLNLAVLAPAEPGSSDASGRALWNAGRGVGVFESDSLPPLASTLVYQLWIFEKDNPAPVPSGFFNPADGTRTELKPARPVKEVAAVAVSVEVSGGRPQPEGPVVLVGKLGTTG